MYPWPQTPIDLQRARDPGELSAEKIMLFGAIPACIVLAIYVVVSFGMLLVLAGMFAAFYFAIEWMMLSYFRGHGVLVGPEQYPELDAMTENFSRRLGVPRPEVYVVQQSLWNAFAAKAVGSRIIVLYSGAVDALLLGGSPEDLGFLVGHEMGHHACGHLDWKYRLVRLGAWIPFLGQYHRRSMELSCDRIALACVGQTNIAVRGLLSMTVGITMMARTNLAAVQEQWRSARRQIGVTILTFYSMYPPHLQRMESVLAAAEQWGFAPPNFAAPSGGAIPAVGQTIAPPPQAAALSAPVPPPPPAQPTIAPPPSATVASDVSQQELSPRG
ncbi:MAG: M48 family metallopeptidase [Myxococcales bacterium]|nr:M48 family metallopeptidase [Myxococcales bacterium]